MSDSILSAAVVAEDCNPSATYSPLSLLSPAYLSNSFNSRYLNDGYVTHANAMPPCRLHSPQSSKRWALDTKPDPSR